MTTTGLPNRFRVAASGSRWVADRPARGAATGDQASPVAKLRRARPRHEQLPPSHCRTCAFRLSRRRCVFAHRAAGRGAGPRQPSQRRRHRAHHRCAARLPREDGGEGCVRARVSSPPRPAGSPRTALPSSSACATSSTSSSRSSTARPRLISPSRAAPRSSIPRRDSVIVFDIGGGSTEIAWLDGQAPHAFADPLQAHPRLGFAARRRGDAGRAPRRHRSDAGKLSRAWSRR